MGAYSKSLMTLLATFTRLALQVDMDKLLLYTYVLTFLGMEIDTHRPWSSFGVDSCHES